MIRSVAALVVVALCLAGAADGQESKPLVWQVVLRDGSIFDVTVPAGEFEWQSISETGDVTAHRWEYSRVQALSLSDSPAAEQIAHIRRLLDGLSHPSYETRRDAELALVAEGQTFLPIISRYQNTANPEARYRLARVIEQLASNRDRAILPRPLEFDTLTSVEGQTLDGDLGDWTLACQWRSQPLKLHRDETALIRQPVAFSSDDADGTFPPAIATNWITSADAFFKDNQPLPGIEHLTFETAGDDLPLERSVREPVDDLFAYAGARLSCETEDGDVVLSAYRFRQSISRENSVCNYYVEPVSKKEVRFNGIMQIRFCVPGQAQIPATVHSAASFIEIVEPRQTVVEAWNAAGHVMGLTQVDTQRSSFAGVDSSHPIAAVTVQANTYLDASKINADFAIDDLCFDTPHFAPELNPQSDADGPFAVTDRQGNRYLANQISSNDGQNVTFTLAATGAELVLALNEVAWIAGPQTTLPTPPDNFDGLCVMTTSGSVVHVSAQNRELILAQTESLSPQDIMGVWNARTPARYPQPDDFQPNDFQPESLVVVEPLKRTRVAGRIDWDEATIEFNLETAEVLEQPIETPAEVPVPSALTQDDTSPARLSLSEAPTIWFAPPVFPPANAGLLRLHDGQQFVLSDDSEFQFHSFEGDRITIRFGETPITVPLSDVNALRLPD